MTVTFACANKDRFIVWMSFGITLLVVSLGSLILYLSLTQPPGGLFMVGLAVGVTTSSVLASIVALCYIYSIRSYILDGDRKALTIQRVVGRKLLLLQPPVSARTVDRTEMKGTIHTFGNGGFFSYQGEFRNRVLGPFLMYSSNSRKNVLVTNAAMSVLVSPADTQAFIAAVNAMSGAEP